MPCTEASMVARVAGSRCEIMYCPRSCGPCTAGRKGRGGRDTNRITGERKGGGRARDMRDLDS